MSLYDIEVKTISGKPMTMREYAGKTVLVVNVASQCGFTPQYAGLEALWKKYQDKGLVILGFPCDQFGGQEPGTEEQIQSFCQLNFGVTFPLFSKIEVNGKNAHPLFQELKKAAPGLLGTEAIKWNFTKFLVDKNGTVVERFSPRDTPESIEKKIEAQLS